MLIDKLGQQSAVWNK